MRLSELPPCTVYRVLTGVRTGAIGVTVERVSWDEDTLGVYLWTPPGCGVGLGSRATTGSLEVEIVNFQFDGVEPPAAAPAPAATPSPAPTDALAQLAQHAGLYEGPWRGNPDFIHHVQRMAKGARSHPQGDALVPIMLAYYRGQRVQWNRGGGWYDAALYQPQRGTGHLLWMERYNHGIGWSSSSTYRIKPS